MKRFIDRPTQKQIRAAIASQAPLDREVEITRHKRKKRDWKEGDSLDGIGGTDEGEKK